MLRARGRSGDVGQVDFSFGRAGQLHFGFLRSFLETLEGHGVVAQVEAFVLGLELVGEEVDDDLVEVIAAEVGVAVGAQYFKHAVAQLQNRDVERATAEVVHGDFLVLVLLVEAVSQSGSGGLVDDALHVEAGDGTGFFRGLALGVVEVRGHRDNGFGHGLAEVILRGLLHFLKYHG